METPDIELLRAYECDGDESAFAILVERHGGWISAAARRRLGDDHLADDATQAVFVVLAQKAPQLLKSGQGSLSAWLFHVMHFSCARVRRSQSRQARREEAAKALRERDKVGHVLPEGALVMLMEDSIAQLPDLEREIVVRRFYQKESFAEIGKALDITAEAARKRASRALAEIQSLMVRDGVDVIPDSFLDGLNEPGVKNIQSGAKAIRHQRIDFIAKGTVNMMEQAKTYEYSVMSAEFFVTNVEKNLEFFEKLGFRRRYVETADAMGRIPRASLVAGVGRIWLRQADASEGTRPSPGVMVYFWIDGGTDGLQAHRKKIADEGVSVSPFTDDVALRNFTVKTPDGYSIGFFAQYR